MSLTDMAFVQLPLLPPPLSSPILLPSLHRPFFFCCVFLLPPSPTHPPFYSFFFSSSSYCTLTSSSFSLRHLFSIFLGCSSSFIADPNQINPQRRIIIGFFSLLLSLPPLLFFSLLHFFLVLQNIFLLTPFFPLLLSFLS